MSVTLHTKEYEEIVKRLDKIAGLQKQLLFAVKMRDPHPVPVTNRREPEADQKCDEIPGGAANLSHSGPEWLLCSCCLRVPPEVMGSENSQAPAAQKIGRKGHRARAGGRRPRPLKP